VTSKADETANEPSTVPMISDGRPVHQDDSWDPSTGGRPVQQDDNRAAVGTGSGDAADFKKKLKEVEEALLGKEEQIIKELEEVRIQDKYGTTFYLKPCASDSQVWTLRKRGGTTNEIHGILIVYVDDFLLLAPFGVIRTELLTKLKTIWTLAKEAVLSVENPITFLGIELRCRKTVTSFYIKKSLSNRSWTLMV